LCWLRCSRRYFPLLCSHDRRVSCMYMLLCSSWFTSV
jgi:hypothetical protein